MSHRPSKDEIVYDVELVETACRSIDPAHKPANSISSHFASEASRTPGPVGRPAAESNRSIIERLLSPLSLQIMMGTGGALLVIGLVVWLWSIGLFANPITVAVLAGAANLSLLAGGVWIYKKTRFRLAGRGLTLLSSLVLPLHLWFYDAQSLIVLDNGGHLWIPALACCIIYALVARTTRDSMFVYTVAAGIVITGLLFLANPVMGSLWAALPLSTFLIAVGFAFILGDRLFTEASGAFSRTEFGLASFRAGHIVLACGLAVLLCSQFITLVAGTSGATGAMLMATTGQKIWGLGCIVVAIYAYIRSHIERKTGPLFIGIACLLTVWAVVVVLMIFAIKLTLNLVLLAVAILLVVINGLVLFEIKSNNHVNELIAAASRTFVPVTGLVLLFIGGLQAAACLLEPRLLGPTFTLQLFATAIALWSIPQSWNAPPNNALAIPCTSGGASALTLAVVTLLLGFTSVSTASILLVSLAVPAAISIAATVVRGERISSRVAISSASAGSTVLFLLLITFIGHLISFTSVHAIVIVAAIALLYFFASIATTMKFPIIPAVVASGIALTQLAIRMQINNPAILIGAATSIGVLLLWISVAVARTAAVNDSDASNKSNVDGIGQKEESRMARVSHAMRLTADIVILLGAVAGVLYSLITVAAATAGPTVILMLGSQLLCIAAGYLSANKKTWRKAFAAAAVVTVAAAVLTVVSLSSFTLAQRAEIASLVIGTIMLSAGLAGWTREQKNPDGTSEEKKELVTLNLVVGSLLLVVPMISGLVAYRVFGLEASIPFWRWLHEVGGLLIGLVLLGSGIVCRIRSMTLAATALLVTYVGSILFLVRWPEQLQSVSVLMMIGGGTFFMLALMLSLYRDYVISIPQRIREGKGLFTVFKWR